MHKTPPINARDRAEDAVWLLDEIGEHPELVAARLGTTVSALEKSVRKHIGPHRGLMNAAMEWRKRRAG